jgi:Spy/CpxP family protein refolding chaperone
MEKPWKVVCAFVLVFMSGAIFGGVFTVGFSARRQSIGTKVSPPARPATAAAAAGQPKAAPATPQSQPSAGAATAKTNPITPTLMRQFTQRLKLTAEQRERIRPIVTRAGEDLIRLRQESLADTARVTERMYVDVAALLSPEQRAEIETMQRQMEERVQAERQKRADAAAAEAASRPEKKAPVARPAPPKAGTP